MFLKKLNKYVSFPQAFKLMPSDKTKTKNASNQKIKQSNFRARDEQ